MWEPRPLTILRASTACYRDSFTFYRWFCSEDRVCIRIFPELTTASQNVNISHYCVSLPHAGISQHCAVSQGQTHSHLFQLFLPLLKWTYFVIHYAINHICWFTRDIFFLLDLSSQFLSALYLKFRPLKKSTTICHSSWNLFHTVSC
jgi:hypothetical protein